MAERRKTDRAAAAAGIKQFLEAFGIDLTAERMEGTPDKVAAAFSIFFSGLEEDGLSFWGDSIETKTGSLVAVRRLTYYSICEHHLLPFFGTVSIAYLPKDGRIAGFGRFAEAVRIFSRRPQLQERMTEQICESVQRGLGALGVVVVVTGRHLCLTMRNTLSDRTDIVTVAATGALAEGTILYERALKILEADKRDRKTDNL